MGPHRDDLDLDLNGLPARTHASQGEQRTLALALRLAAHRLVTERVGSAPVLLLDDVFSELDGDRSAALLAHLPQGQVLLTTAGPLPGGRSSRAGGAGRGREAAGMSGTGAPEPKALRDSVDDVVRSLRGTSARSLAGVFARWEEAVGPQVAAHAQPASLVDGCLVVDVDHPDLGHPAPLPRGRPSRPACADVAGVDEVSRIELRVRPR